MAIKRILVVDDSPTERMAFQEILTGAGYEVLLATSGEEGIELAKSLRPDAIVMDVVMPGINGFQATRELSRHEETKSIPVIMCTTKGQETDKIWGLRQGAVAYLVKPVDPKALLDELKRLG
jgi:twitching motility two-component system response regulator PilH